MYTCEYLNSLGPSQLLELIDVSGFPSMAAALNLNLGTRLNHIDDLARAYRLNSECEFSFTEYCKVEQLLFTFFDLVDYKETKIRINGNSNLPTNQPTKQG